MVASNSLQNLYMDVQSSGGVEGAKPGGDPIERVITLRNRGDRTAEIELWLEPADVRAEPLRQWGSFNKSDIDLRLAPADTPGDTIDVTLSFLVPLEAEPRFYGYDLRVRSPQYPNEDLRRSQQLQVLSTGQDVVRTEPKLTLNPATSSTDPHVLQTGTDLTLQLTVENPSRRTDRFFLTCTDLPPDWFTVTYPDNDTNTPGRLTQTDGLQLNPRETGTIALRIHPPSYTAAGNYYPTLRLTSSNRADLVMLEIVYLTIPVDDRLEFSLNPVSCIVPSAEEQFEILLKNPGNLARELLLSGHDPENVFKYQIAPELVQLQPGQEQLAILRPKPRHGWRQAWRLRERTIEFDVEVQNADLLASAIATGDTAPALLPDSSEDSSATRLPALPDTIPVGKIIWKAKRRWLFWLLFITLALGAITTATGLIWYFLFWRPSLRPRIVEFTPTQETYQEGGAPVTFDWEITNPEKIGAIALEFDRPSSEEDDSQTSDKPLIYSIEQDSSSSDKFLLSLLNPNSKSEEEKILCRIDQVEGGNSILATLLKFQRRQTTDSPNTQVLQCRAVALEGFATEEGKYQIRLKVYPETEEEIDKNSSVAAIKTLKDVVIGPPAPPQILSLTADASEYRVVTLADIAPDAEATPSPPSQISAAAATIVDTLAQPATSPLAPIELSWEISNLKEIGSLRLVSLDPNGAENTTAEPFDFSQGLPSTLAPFCQENIETNQLICTQVPTTATKVGEYVFYLTVIPKDGPGQEDIVKSTATIPIKPPLPNIANFTLNGESIATNPKRVFIVNPARGFFEVILTWDVQDAVQVELLPAPGVIQGSTLSYTISSAPGSEMITLRAVNELEEEITQTVVIEKVSYDPTLGGSSAGAAGAAPGATAQPGGSALPPLPLPTIPIPGAPPPTPTDLPPAEEPPQAN